MDEERAVKLLDKVFNSKYSDENYEEFIVHLLNDVKFTKTNCNSFVSDYKEFTGFVENFEYFGRFRDKSGKIADILSIKLARDN